MAKVHNPRLTSVKSILTAALDRIENVGWCQFAHCRYKGGKVVGYCASGAVRSVSRGEDYSHRALKVLERARRIESVIGFNDNPKRKKSEVVAAFKLAISKA